ncbi:MAG: P27 family phage terminase small subunit [Geminicoccaceae bacterium]
MRGRKPLPSNVVRLRGNPGKRRLNDAEPRPAPRVPTCPACLGDEARKEWQRLARELSALGLLTGLDRAMLAAYCQAHALWVEAVASIERYGTMVKSPIRCRAPTSRSRTSRSRSWSGSPPSSA